MVRKTHLSTEEAKRFSVVAALYAVLAENLGRCAETDSL
jgi:hypothetical protein